MNVRDPNLGRVELVATALGPLRDELVFVGGCAAGLLMSDPGATPIRATVDVDLVARVTALSQYHKLEEVFTQFGFKRDPTAEAPICRWRYRGIAVDLMPTDRNVLGFANRWYGLAMETAQRVSLSSGIEIRLISGPAFIGTKFQAFADRGQGDLLASHDLEDVSSSSRVVRGDFDANHSADCCVRVDVRVCCVQTAPDEWESDRLLL